MQDSSFFESISLLRRRRNNIGVGERYVRTRPDHTVETVKVVSVMKDPVGIPHVRYDLTIKKPQRPNSVSEGSRLLALEAFSEAYRKRVGS